PRPWPCSSSPGSPRPGTSAAASPPGPRRWTRASRCTEPPPPRSAASPRAPPGVAVPPLVCCESQPAVNRLTRLPGSARVGRHLADDPSSAGRVSRDWHRPRRCPIVIDRLRVTPWTALTGPKGDVRLGDVCPEPAHIGTKLRDLGPIAAAVPAAPAG